MLCYIITVNFRNRRHPGRFPRLPVTRFFDASAIALSTLCLIHCLALPLLVALLPMLGAWAGDERIHVAFAALAVPMTSHALWRAHRHRRLPWALRALAALGLAGLLAGALGWPRAAWETPITVGGSLMLVGAHLWNWSRYHQASALPQ